MAEQPKTCKIIFFLFPNLALSSFLSFVSNVFRTADTQCMIVHLLLIWNWIFLAAPSAWADHRRHNGSNYTIEVLLQERLAGVLLETVPLSDYCTIFCQWLRLQLTLRYCTVSITDKSETFTANNCTKYSPWIGCLSWVRAKISVHKYGEISEEAWVILDSLWEIKATKRTRFRMSPWSELNELDSDE
jgi:hypothetical protein